MTNQPKIWISNAPNDIRLQHKGVPRLEFDEEKTTPEEKSAFHKRYNAWHPLDATEVPTKMSFAYHDLTEKQKIIKDWHTITSGYVIISERLADLLQEFDLGKTQLFEVSIYEYDKVTKRPEKEKLYLLNVAETKPTVVYEQSSESVKQLGNGRWRTKGYIDKTVVLPASSEGADLWADPLLKGTVFLTDRLAKAIKAAKLSWIPMKPCQIAVEH